MARFAVLALALALSAGAARAARAMSFGLALAVTLTTSLSGHAADWGDVTPSSGIDWVHVVAVSAWTGGLIALTFGVLRQARQWPLALLGPLMRRFSRLAGLCLATVLASGIYNAWIQLPGPSALWTTSYGRVLSVKVLLVLVLIGWGALNRYTIVPRLDRRRRAGIGERCFRLARWAILGSSRVRRAVIPSRLALLVGREAALALVVFGCTAVLVDSTPPRHADHLVHEAVSEPGQVRMSMEELHEHGGVPQGWIFAPPDGDPVHGRDVFVKLGCYACHRVRGEKFPAPGGPGPDLTGVGHHHPAGYVLESILNPNAVIVEGRGYTGPDGKSIMPDYRGQLSVTDLIDLVAYVKSL
ncbi:MAG: hypothetical protein C5B48_09695 [Candidatus Rokuibacteriota bacterium]|nr:MAG: hypothetical protein C5B48_09695 [Candidatus Rokubacteria bacterium]